MFEPEIDPRSDDTCREDPFRDIDGNVWLDLSRPFIEGKKIDCGEGIDGVNGSGDDQREPEIGICEGIPARCGFEIIETLRQLASILGREW